MATVNLNSETSCRRAYLNYHTQGNTLNISAYEMGQIASRWGDHLEDWQKYAGEDFTEYDFDDSEYSSFIEEGKEAASEATGHDGKLGGEVTHSWGSVGMSTAGVGFSMVNGGGCNIVQPIKTLATKSFRNGSMSKEATKFGDLSVYIAAASVIVQGIMGMWGKVNEEEKNAVDELQAQMEGADAALSESEAELTETGEKINELNDEAVERNEEANEEIANNKTEQDMYRATYERLKAKAEAGESLTPEEQELYKSAAKYMQDINKNITTIQNDTSEEINDINSDIESSNSVMDDSLENIGQIEGLTEFASSIDKKTQNNCYREGTSQALNVLSAATVTLKLTTLGWWNWILAGFTATAGVFSFLAAKKQFIWAGEVGNEIKMREGVQAHTENTKAVYEAEKENFEVSLADIKGLELEVPKEYDADVSALPTDNNQANPDSLLLINSQNEDNQINNNENPNDSDPNNRKPEDKIV